MVGGPSPMGYACCDRPALKGNDERDGLVRCKHIRSHGCAASKGIGRLNELNVALLLALIGIYDFAIIGDSSVLSSAMTDAVPASQLGRARQSMDGMAKGWAVS